MRGPASRIELASLPTVKSAGEPEPEVEAAAELAPGFLPPRESRQYCATPAERASWAESQIDEAPPRVCAAELQVCRSTGETQCRMETAFTVEVQELVFPGGPEDSIPVEGKWLYAFREGKLAVEAFASCPGIWDGASVEGSRRRPWRSSQGVPVDPGPKGNRHTYFFLLSPIRLTRRAIEDLESTQTLELAAVECASDAFGKTVRAPDPLQWAADANAYHHAPRIRTLEAWQYDEEIVTRAFVARALKAWIEGGDRAGVRNELKSGQPEKWLDARQRGVDEALRRADEAAAYLAHCIDSPDYLAIERSALERGGQDLELCAVALSTVTGQLLQTEPGKKLAQRLVSNPDRLPARIIFHDTGDPLPDEWFERFRFGEKGLLGIFGDLLPAVAQIQMGRLQQEMDRKAAAVTMREHVQRYLGNLGNETTLSKPQAQIQVAIEQGGRPVDQVEKGSRNWKRNRKKILQEWDRLVLVAKPPRQIAEDPRWSRGLERYEPLFKGLAWTVGSAFEIANLVCAYEALEKAPAEEKGARTRAMVGAMSDVLEHGTGIAEELLGARLAGTRALRFVKLGKGAFGAIGGTLDMLEYGEQTIDATTQYDYGKAVGRGLSAGGAAAMAVGGGMVAVGAFYGTALGPVGTVVGAVGGVVVAIGFGAAAWLAHNTNEVFASRSFLGVEAGQAPAAVPWSDRHPLPTRSAANESRSLVELLSQFELSSSEGWGDYCVYIRPGYLEDFCRYEVNVTKPGWTRPARVVVDLEDDSVTQVEGVPLKPLSKVSRDGEGNVTSISINLEEASQPDDRPRRMESFRARVRLVAATRSGGSGAVRTVQVSPKVDGEGVEIDVPTSAKISSGLADHCKPMKGERR